MQAALYDLERRAAEAEKRTREGALDTAAGLTGNMGGDPMNFTRLDRTMPPTSFDIRILPSNPCPRKLGAPHRRLGDVKRAVMMRCQRSRGAWIGQGLRVRQGATHSDDCIREETETGRDRVSSPADHSAGGRPSARNRFGSERHRTARSLPMRSTTHWPYWSGTRMRPRSRALKTASARRRPSAA